MEENQISIPSVELNRTFTHNIDNINFGNLSQNILFEVLKDGRPFSHFIEKWIEINYPLIHVSGCKKYDFKDANNPLILYDEKLSPKVDVIIVHLTCWVRKKI